MRQTIDIVETVSKEFYHVTEREFVDDIVTNGFIGGWGDVGFGVYFYGNLYSSQEYAAKRGWDGALVDPVILAVTDPSIEKVIDVNPEWNSDDYADMFWREMDPDNDEERWVPAHIRVLT